MKIEEDANYSRDYLDPDKRSIANAIQIFFTDGSATDKIAVEYPLGHRRRRGEGIPLLEKKFVANLQTRFQQSQCNQIVDLCMDQNKLEKTPVDEFMQLFVMN